MATDTYRGVMHGGKVVFLENGTPLPDGTEVVVTAVVSQRGAPANVLAAVEKSPKVPGEWVDELEQFIAEGRRPPTHGDPFQEGQ